MENVPTYLAFFNFYIALDATIHIYCNILITFIVLVVDDDDDDWY